MIRKLNRPLLRLLAPLIFFPALVSGLLNAEIRLPAVIGSHMVLQQDQPINIWGWAEPGEALRLQMAGLSVNVRADTAGRWKAVFNPLKAEGRGEPLVLVIKGSQSPEVRLEDILVGEVWVCSGQSNMEWTLGRTHSPSAEIRRADLPHIRLFQVPRRTAVIPQEDMESEWVLCRPETARDFSAVAYYFGREIHSHVDVPVGLISTSWGGTRIEPWTPPAGFKAVPEVSDILDVVDESRKTYRINVGRALPDLQEWVKTASEAVIEDTDPSLPPELPDHPLNHPQQPTSLYNGMVHALVPFGIRGALWYQGEANRNDGPIYEKKMEALIKGWREIWGQGDFPFYWVQLAPYNYPYNREMTGGDIPDFLRLPLIWEAQREALRIPNTGMAVITDISNLSDIHPRNKIEVGRRLALWARAMVYGEKAVVYSGPLYQSMQVEGNKIRIRFDHTGTGLISMDGKDLSWFEIAGEDRIFYKARAEILDGAVMVYSHMVPNPVAVRFGWHQLAEPNLANSEGLPASPFRTDRW